MRLLELDVHAPAAASSGAIAGAGAGGGARSGSSRPKTLVSGAILI